MPSLGASTAAQDVDQLTGLFRLLSDPTRLSILLRLVDGERNVSSLCDELGLPQPTVSHHLGLLRLNNVIGNRRKGKQVFYALNGVVNLQGDAMEIGLEHFTVRIGARATEPIA